jgi:hypothetical protein
MSASPGWFFYRVPYEGRILVDLTQVPTIFARTGIRQLTAFYMSMVSSFVILVM